MERIEALGQQLSQITMYDIKSVYNQVIVPHLLRLRYTYLDTPNQPPIFSSLTTYIRLQAKNIVLNVSEMEAKVREATNEDPW